MKIALWKQLSIVKFVLKKGLRIFALWLVNILFLHKNIYINVNSSITIFYIYKYYSQKVDTTTFGQVVNEQEDDEQIKRVISTQWNTNHQLKGEEQQCMLQYSWTLKTRCQAKKGKRTTYYMFRFIQNVQNRVVVAKGWVWRVTDRGSEFLWEVIQLFWNR